MKIRDIQNALFRDGGLKLLRDYLLFKAGHGKIRPQSLNAAIDYRCNEKCRICYNSAYLDFEASMGHDCRILLSVEEWRKIFLKYKKEGVGSLVLTGGEPLLRPEVVDAAYEIFKRSCITITNGTRPINPKWRTRFFVSIHSATPAIHDYLCGKNGTLDLIKKNIANDDRVIISFVLNADNVNDIKPMVEMAKALNVGGIIISGYTPSRRSVEEEENKPDPLELTKNNLKFIIPELMKVWEENKDFVFMSPEIIKLFWTQKHQKGCSLRDGWVLSLNSAGEPIDQCVMGRGAKCKGCQCIIPKQMEATKWAIPRALMELSFNPIIYNMKAVGVFTYEPRK